MTAVPPTADEINAACRYAVGSLLISLDSQGGYASTLATLAADDVSASGCATIRPGWKRSRRRRWRRWRGSSSRRSPSPA